MVSQYENTEYQEVKYIKKIFTEAVCLVAEFRVRKVIHIVSKTVSNDDVKRSLTAFT